MYREMHSTSDILSYEGIERIDKGLDGNLVVPRRWVHGRDLGKTFPTPIVTFDSIDSIPSSHVHFPSATSTTPSISIAAQDFAQYFSSHDDLLISQDSSFDDLLSSSTAFSLPAGVGLGILGLTRKEGEDPFDGLDLVHIHRSSQDPSSDGELSQTILREAELTFLQPSRCVVGDRVDDEEFGLAGYNDLGKDMVIRYSQRDTTRKRYDLTVVHVEFTRAPSCDVEGSAEADRGGSILDIVASGRAVG
ncbi:hypothetical protein EDD85DRAFT_963093 [Armillaria nabsnona]|nr:hypothetical protein EDD85DRAFT_963093 [Armillaria nabsnona]